MTKVNDALVNAETLSTALGTDGATITDSALSVVGAIGANNANNAFSSSAVVANADGSVLEREEFIQTKIAELKAIEGALTDAADNTAATATIMKLLRWLDQNIGAFDGAADPQGSIYRALGVGAVKSIATLIADVQAVVGLLADVADETASTATLANQIRSLLSRSIPRIVRKTVTFNGGAGNGAVGTVALFTVTGLVKMRIMAICGTNLASDADPGGATISVGIAGTVDKFIAADEADSIDAGEIWHDATADSVIEADTVSAFWLNNGADAIATIATDDVVSGALTFIVEYIPMSADGAVVAA